MNLPWYEWRWRAGIGILLIRLNETLSNLRLVQGPFSAVVRSDLNNQVRKRDEQREEVATNKLWNPDEERQPRLTRW